MDPNKLDYYMRMGKRLFDDGTIRGAELDFKEQLIAGLEKTRHAVLSGSDDWASLLENVVKDPENRITERRWVQFWPVLRDWLGSEDDRAILLGALKDLWADDDKSAGDRVRAFDERVPPRERFRTRAERLVPIAFLLMAFGHDYPPFGVNNLESAYKYLGYPKHPNSNLGEVYEHELKFLDQLVHHSEGRPVDRLEAQSVVWWLGGNPEKVDTNGPNGDPDPFTERLDNLGKKLLLDPPSFLSKTVWPMLEDKRQIIFQGPPGTGKTWVARKLAECLAGEQREGEPKRVKLVQFHPSFAYEDFVQGFRPTLKGDRAGFELRDGPLRDAAKAAKAEVEKARKENREPEKYFLVIDEINRGNIAKVFGELYFLLEYRDEDGEDNKMRLQYSEQEFSLPKNLYIIGTMNTADRSIALVDAALRRRFYFVTFHPDDPPIKGLLNEWLKENAPEMEGIAQVVDDANKKLGNKDAAIGPSYFMKKNLDEGMADRIWEYNVLPYVEEQLYGDPGTLNEIKALWPDGDGEQGGSDESASGDDDDEGKDV